MDDWDLDLRLPTRKPSSDSDSDSDSISVKHILDPPENPITLAIGIFTHGKILSDDIGDPIPNENFPGVHIVKHNIAGFSCIVINYKKIDTYEWTERAYYDIDSCIDPKTYLEEATAALSGENVSHDARALVPLFSEKGLCQIFRGHTKFYEKLYEPVDETNTIKILVKKNGQFDDIDIIKCTTIKLFKFLTDQDIFEDIVDYHSDYDDMYDEEYDGDEHYAFCKAFIKKREKNRSITTTDLFELIKVSKKTLDVNNVHILDTSCNVINAGLFDIPHEICEGFKIDKTCKSPDPEIAFGGKSKRKSRKRTRKRKARNTKRKK